MSKTLVIVESPAKAKTIQKYLGRNFKVKASVGHVKDLPSKKLGVDIENGFTPQYEVMKDKKKVVAELRKAAQEADVIFLAPDPDREGEAIAWHIAEELAPDTKGKPVYRALFNEITKKAILEAIKNPLELNQNLFNAQQARRILDRIVGYEISPLLWNKVRRGLSAGRVQSVAVRLVVEREREVLAFVPEEYWTIDARFEAATPPPFAAKLLKIDDGKARVTQGDQAGSIVEELGKGEFVITAVDKKERQRKPTPPFITSRLQQEAARKLGYSASRTMMLAQRLYEGIDLGKKEGTMGLITYMRTDSTRISNDALEEVRAYIGAQYGEGHLPEKPNIYKSKKSAQEAHEAIRPTSMAYPPELVKDFVDKDQLKLYTLIWNRFVACQMRPAIYDQTAVDLTNGRYLFRANGSIIRFKGFMEVYLEGTDAPSTEDEEGMLPELAVGDRPKLLELLPNQHFTQPPARFTESTLVKELEEREIGRPSTYASILSTIQDKEYVEKREAKFFPTELGILVNDLLVENFQDILDPAFTAQMEQRLDLIEEGQHDWLKELRDFYGPFAKTLELAKTQMRDVKHQNIETEHLCEKCTKPMVIKWGRRGEFLACSGYPECKNTMEFKREDGKIVPVTGASEEVEGQTCERCNSSLVMRKGRFGEFLACSSYPECKFTRPVKSEGQPEVVLGEAGGKCEECDAKLMVRRARKGNRYIACENYPTCKSARPFPVGVLCPKDGGNLIERAGNRKIFYGCDKYPDCDYVSWDPPIAEVCPDCGHGHLAIKTTKKKGTVIKCPVKECKYERPAPESETPAAV
jgi:DNA topoisomerase I